MTTTTTTTTPALAEPGTAARLTARVCRMPASLGGYHYYLEPGQLVFITGHAGGIPRCSVIADPKERSSEDFFSVPYEKLEIMNPDAIFSGPRHAELVAFHEARGWLNCSHKSLLRLETEHAAIAAEEEETAKRHLNEAFDRIAEAREREEWENEPEDMQARLANPAL